MELVVKPCDRSVQVAPGANLLQVLRKNLIPVSHSCMAGRCGTCRCKLLSGRVTQSGGESQTPTANSDLFVLACQTILTESCTIEIPEPDEIVMHPARVLRATVDAIVPMTHDVRQLHLRLNKPLLYSPGQHVQLQFESGLVRPYSMAGIADSNLEFHIRLIRSGRVTQYLAESLKVGDSVKVVGPLGAAYLRRFHEGPIICVAGSTGLAPILSIARGAIEAGMTNPIHLYFGVRSDEDLYGLGWLSDLAVRHANITAHVVVASPLRPNGFRAGMVTEALAADALDLTGARAYVCGPPPMVEAASLVLQQRGLSREHIYADAFYPAGL